MEHRLYNTDDVRPQDRLAYWREAVCDSYVRLGCDAPARSEMFTGSIALTGLSKVILSQVSGSAQVVTRRPTDIRRAAEDSFLVSLQMHECGVVEQGARVADLSPGDFALYSSTAPYQLRLPDGFRQLVIQIPRAALLDRLPGADHLTGRRVAADGPMTAAVSRSILMLVESLVQADPLVAGHLEQSLTDLVATGLATLVGGDADLKLPEQTILHRARVFIDETLSDPDLDRVRVASALGLSVRRLNELFQKEGYSISAVIRQARMVRIASDLRDPRFAGLSITAIALRHGVRNLDGFASAFRRQFDCTPRDYRQRH
ncbi:AraC-like ligand-binding domain-containing protein [Chachezhania sediminis]|uniref:AraC-like ligand-binding domain-containing protein n=1 Tax=Chachezhania sediminis TaxID=2599291 RepID=UPI00131C4B63|nr:helix-turn-helix domain-containing protein [Chachezhania sediminis]